MKKNKKIAPKKLLSPKNLVLIILVLLTLSISLNNQIYNPYFAFFSPSKNSIEIPLTVSQNFSKDYLKINHNDNFNNYNLDKRKYKYSFVFMMEQTSLEDFYREKDLIKDLDFFDRVKANTHFFSNYYSSNQDSRTAVWEMLNSFFIPHETYIEPWQDYYGYLLETNSLIEHFKLGNIEPYPVSSVGGGSLILGIYPFNKFIHLDDYKTESEGYLCSTQFSYQEACEDMAIFEKFTSNITNNEPPSFYFQELIFGHGKKYMTLSGKTRVEYYNDYFNKFYDFLEAEGIADESLVVIVSDHGPKGGPSRVISDFNIPLMFIASDLDSKEIKGYYSHFSFKDVFLSYYLEVELPKEETFIYLIDQTGRSSLGYLDVAEDYSVLGDLKGNSFFISEEKAKSLDVSIIKEKIEYLLSYRKFVEKLSVENHTYTYIP